MDKVTYEHSVRGTFSLLAASVLLYMSAENADLFFKYKKIQYLAFSAILAICSVWEAWKVGNRVEHVLKLK